MRQEEIREEARSIVKLLSLEEKLSLLSGASMWSLASDCVTPHLVEGTNNVNERVPRGPVLVSDGPHGLRKTLTDKEVVKSVSATCFPTGTALACSWNLSLVEEVGRALASFRSAVSKPSVNHS